ncbi:MAG: phosphonoacetaldehyde reductase [Methylococcaceae bacterium]
MTEIRIAHGEAGNQLTQFLRLNGTERILIIASERCWLRSGLNAVLEQQLPKLQIVLFHQFTPNPGFEEVMAGCELRNSQQSQMILGLGGGSAMDIAKSVALLANYSEQEARNIIETSSQNFTDKVCPLVLIPTTAGSGSEATHFAVIYLDDKKYSLATPVMLPDLSIVDGSQTYSAAPLLAASCGIDALCQAIESYWAVSATKDSQAYAIKAIKILNQHLITAVLSKAERVSNNDARNKVAEAACLAGQAINISKTTAAHAYSYYLTSKHQIPHGHAVSLCFPAVAQCNFNSKKTLLSSGELANRYKKLFDVIGVSGIEEFILWFKNLTATIGLEQNLEKLGFKPQQEMEGFLTSVNIERLKNNPAIIDIDKFKQLFLDR